MDEKKLKYYNDKKLKERLYKSCIKKENKNYDKPCLENIGHNQISVYGKNVLKYSLSYALHNNIFIEDILKEDKDGIILQICHGNGCSRDCIEPTHLSLKTVYENNYEDKIRDNTLLRGENHYNAIMTQDLADKIRLTKGDGRTQQQRADDFGVPKGIVNDIDREKSWSKDEEKNKQKREKDRESRKKAKEKEFTDQDWEEALGRLKKRSKESEELAHNGKVNTKYWLCLTNLTKNGYGAITFKNIPYRTHVLAFEAKIRKKRDKNTKLVVRHLCDVRNCCNPDHVELGTNSQNSVDARSYSKSTKLTEDKVREIKILLRDGKLTQKEIAEKFNVNRRVINQINCGKSWKDVKI